MRDRFRVLPTTPTRTHRLTHHSLMLADGHRVGVSVGGKGIPLVVQHGVAMNRRTYIPLIDRLASLGFMVVAIDAGGHGETTRLPEPRDFSMMTALTMRSLDALGIHKAVLLGHSMGGRMAIELAAKAPDRVLAAVLLDAAAGETFDQKAFRADEAPTTIAWGLLAAFGDAALEHHHLRGRLRLRYSGIIARTILQTALRPLEPLWAIRAISAASDSSAMLQAMADNDVSTIVVHGSQDLIVPLQSAVDMASTANAVLVEIPHASHGWALADPERATSLMRHLLDTELGEAIQYEYMKSCPARRMTRREWIDSLTAPDALVRRLVASAPDA